MTLPLGPKGGYLYAKILEVGNLDALEPTGVCCDPLSGGCPGLQVPPCGSRQPAQLRVQLTCASLERTPSNSSPAALDTKMQKAVFNQELLMKSLHFCSVDTLTISLQCKNVTLGEASVPLRVALPTSLTRGCAPQPDAARALPSAEWLPVQRIALRRPKTTSLLTSATPTPAKKAEPYVELQLLQLMDSSLPALQGTTPLMLAIEQRQQQLVRAYLSLDVAETLPAGEQEACITTAIQRRYHEVLVLLLDRIKPLHDHLLLAIRLRASELVEALLQADGAPLLHPRPRLTRDPSQRRGVGRHRPDIGAMQPPIAGVRQVAEISPPLAGSTVPVGGGSQAATEGLAASGERNRGPHLTPLSVACSLGDVAMVEVICQWAMREKVQVDPTAPLLLGLEAPTVSIAVAGRGADAGGGGVTPWWEQEDPASDGRSYGDPPMVMAVRGRGSIANKIGLVNALARVGFSADARSPVDSWTPLLAAVDLGNLELVSALCKLGARLSADRQLGFTPLHLACQMAHWHLVPVLADLMCSQYSRVAAWGPSPQYVSFNILDSYGRTPLDIALLRYFANPLGGPGDSSGKSPSSGSERQKAVDILREFVHRTPPEDPGIVCGWEFFGVPNFLDKLPSKKAVSAQLWGADWADKPCPGEAAAEGREAWAPAPAPAAPEGDIQELLEAVRVLVRAGGQTKYLLEGLLQPPARNVGQGLESTGENFRECLTALGPRLRPHDRNCKYSVLDADDFSEVSVEDAAPVRSV